MSRARLLYLNSQSKKMSRLHLVYGEAGAGTLRLALSTEGSEDCVVSFPAILNYAPLFPSFD